MEARRDYDDIQIGDRSALSKTITEADIFAFCGITGDFNPIHVDEAYARQTRWGGRIAHGMLIAGLVDRTLAALGGDGTVHISQEVSFQAPVHIGDTITVVTEVAEKIADKRRLLVSSVWTNQDGVIVMTGRGELLVPRERRTTV